MVVYNDKQEGDVAEENKSELLKVIEQPLQDRISVDVFPIYDSFSTRCDKTEFINRTTADHPTMRILLGF